MNIQKLLPLVSTALMLQLASAPLLLSGCSSSAPAQLSVSALAPVAAEPPQLPSALSLAPRAYTAPAKPSLSYSLTAAATGPKGGTVKAYSLAITFPNAEALTLGNLVLGASQGGNTYAAAYAGSTKLPSGGKVESVAAGAVRLSPAFFSGTVITKRSDASGKAVAGGTLTLVLDEASGTAKASGLWVNSKGLLVAFNNQSYVVVKK